MSCIWKVAENPVNSVLCYVLLLQGSNMDQRNDNLKLNCGLVESLVSLRLSLLF